MSGEPDCPTVESVANNPNAITNLCAYLFKKSLLTIAEFLLFIDSTVALSSISVSASSPEPFEKNK